MLLINKIKRYNLDEQLNDNGVRNLIYLTNPEDEASPFHYYTTDFDDAVMLMDKLPTLKTEPIWDTFDMDPRELRDILDQIDNLIGSRDGWYRNVDISNVDIGDEYRSNGYYEDEYLDASYED